MRKDVTTPDHKLACGSCVSPVSIGDYRLPVTHDYETHEDQQYV